MKTVFFPWGSSRGILPALISVLIVITSAAQADQVEMQNGDRYSGKVMALESNIVVLKSDTLGTIRLRRDQIGSMSFGAKQTSSAPTVPKAPPVPVVSSATADPQLNLNSSLSHSIAANPNLVGEIRNQVLSGAGPKALQKYDTLIGGLSTGNLNVTDIRKEAASVAAQLRQLGSSADDESAAIYQDYLAILDSFLAETQTAIPTTKPTKPVKPALFHKPKPSPAAAPAKPAASPKLDDE